MPPKANPDWPVLTSYDADHLARIALPLGGIGTGTVSLGGRGDLRDWEIVNRPAKGFTPERAFFALWARPAGGEPVTRALEGVLQPPYEGGSGAAERNHGLPRFRSCEFRAAYPFGQVLLADRDVPVDVRLEAFNPLVPADLDRSGVPVAVLRFVLSNRTARTVDASVCGTITNFIGTDGTAGEAKANRNEMRVNTGRPRLGGLFMSSDGVDAAAEQWGTMALTVPGAVRLSHRATWPRARWNVPLLRFWDDFSDDGRLEETSAEGDDMPIGSLAASVRIPPRGEKSVTFLLTWHFPNRRSWTPVEDADVPCQCDPAEYNTIGNYYATQYQDAWDVAVRVAENLPALEAETLKFVRAFCGSDLPDAVKEAALCNVSTLRSQTCFRTRDGLFFGFEGCSDRRGCCQGSCTHVWNYELASPFLFGEIARMMRSIEFGHATDERGLMSFRVNLPLDRAKTHGIAAADGQMGCILKMYRDWQLSGDDQLLRELWPNVRRALEFCWIPGGWDADRDGVMEGCQHNTMDVEYYGPNPQMTVWYLGALRAAEEMARYLGDKDFADRCRALFERGSEWVDQNLFNGEYYEHEIRPPKDPSEIAPGLRHGGMGAEDVTRPDFQIGAGCLVDQLVGQFLAHICGLGYLVRPANARKTLRSILKYNGRSELYGHFNNMRTFALNDEAALLMCAYPAGQRPDCPFPYWSEVMTGFEYTAAVLMLYEGLTDEGVRCIENVRRRYDGRRRNPFDEPECGHHYARAMASWAAVLALTGFHYSAVRGEVTFAPADRPAVWFWSAGDAWGTVRQEPGRDAVHMELEVLFGTLKLRRLALAGFGAADLGRMRSLKPGSALTCTVPKG
jgi:uncharacterized protein (DUF608 family)